MAGAAVLLTVLPAASDAHVIVVPFDFSRHEVGLTVAVHGVPLYMFLDTGVSPSAIDADRAKSLGLKVDYAGGGEASGDGDTKHVVVYPTTIDELTIGGQPFAAVPALAADFKQISGAYRRRVDGTLGYSFLVGKLTLIDYANQTVAIADQEADFAPQLDGCSHVWRVPLRSFPGDKIPVVELEIGGTHLPVSIDTGSNGNLELYSKVLDEPAVNAALVETGSHEATGTRGGYTVKTYTLNAPIRLGPFVLQPGQAVSLSRKAGSRGTRLANVGNRLIASLGVKLLLDYRKNRIAFFGDCTGPGHPTR